MTKILAFEGIDGTGKSVQMARLQERLVSEGKRVLTLSFPRYDSFFGKQAGELLAGKNGVRADEVDQKSMALWYALDRFEAFRDLRYTAYDVLLINRYVLSNAAYQSVRDRDLSQPDLLDYVLTLEHEHFRIPRADAHLVLDMDTESAAGNVDKKGFRAYVGNTRDVYEAIPGIQQRARRKYLEFASRLDNVFVIPCMENGRLKSIASIGERIDAVLTDIL